MLTSLKNTARMYRIAMTLAQHDALFGLEALKVSPFITFTVGLFAKRQHRELRRGQRLARACEALGPTFIKLGQALSVRPDLVGEAISNDLAELRDQIPPFDSNTARRIIEEEYEKPLNEIFSHFEDKPVAAASIAQVHFATTVSGEDVAVKILRPNIEKAFAKDMDLLYWLAEIAERRLPKYRRLKPRETIDIFRQTIEFELDLRYEAAAATELRENTLNDTGFYVPEIHWPLCTQRVLVSERIHGISLNDREALEKADIDFSRLVEIAATAFFQQVFRDGFFHADLHPGNLFVLPDNSLAVVDFGIMGRIDRQMQLYLAEMLWAFLNEEYEKVARIHINAGFVPKSTSVKQFAQANRAIAKPILGKPLNEISIAKLLGQLFQVAETFQMETQPQLLLLQKTMMLAEGVGRMFQPDVNMWKMAQPLITSWAKSNLSPQAQIRDTAVEVSESLRRLPALIRQTESFLQHFHEGGLKLHPQTVEMMRGNGRSQRQWMTFAWVALLLLGALVAVEFSLITALD